MPTIIVCVCVCRSEVDPDSALQEADARRLFEGMLQALSDVRKRERETHTHTHMSFLFFIVDGKTYFKFHYKDTT